MSKITFKENNGDGCRNTEKEPDMATSTYRVSKTTFDKMLTYAKRAKISRSRVVRIAVSEFLNMKACPVCGKKSPSNALFCSYCAAPLTDEAKGIREMEHDRCVLETIDTVLTPKVLVSLLTDEELALFDEERVNGQNRKRRKEHSLNRTEVGVCDVS